MPLLLHGSVAPTYLTYSSYNALPTTTHGEEHDMGTIWPVWCRTRDRLLNQLSSSSSVTASVHEQEEAKAPVSTQFGGAPHEWQWVEQWLLASTNIVLELDTLNKHDNPYNSSWMHRQRLDRMVQSCWDVLDRLCPVASQHQQPMTQHAPNHHSTTTPSNKSSLVHVQAIQAVLDLWKQQHDHHRQVQEQQQKLTSETTLLSPWAVLQKLAQYTSVGLCGAVDKDGQPIHARIWKIWKSMPQPHNDENDDNNRVTVEMVLDWMTKQSQDDPHSPWYPTADTIHWALCHETTQQQGLTYPSLAHRAEGHLEWLTKGWNQTGRDELQPTPSVLVQMMKIFGHCCQESPSSPLVWRRLEELANQLVETLAPCNDDSKFHTLMMDHVLVARSNVERDEVNDKVTAVIAWVLWKSWLSKRAHFKQHFSRQDESDNNPAIGHSTTTPIVSTAMAVVSALVRGDQWEQATHLVQQDLTKLVFVGKHQEAELFENPSVEREKEDRRNMLILLWAFAKIRQFRGAMSFLHGLEQKLGHFIVVLDEKDHAATWDLVLDIWSDYGGRIDSPVVAAAHPIAFLIRVHRSLLTKRQQQEQGKQQETKSTERFLLNSFLSHCADNGSEDAANAALEVIRWMDLQNSPKIQPDRYSHFYVLRALKNAKRADTCYEYLKDLCHHDGGPKTKPRAALDPRLFSVVMAAQPKTDRMARRAREIFDWMEQASIEPDTVCYTTLFTAIAKSNHAPTMGKNVDDEDIGHVIAELVRKMTQKMNPNRKGDTLKADASIYEAILLGLSKSSSSEHLDWAKSFLTEMKRVNLKPTRTSYRALMMAWAQLQQPEKVEHVFQELRSRFLVGEIDHKPDYNEYTVRLKCWSAAGNPEMTQTVLEEMQKEYELGALKTWPGPNEFNAVIEAWANSSKPNAVERTEWELREWLRVTGENEMDLTGSQYSGRPNTGSFAPVLSAFVKSNRLNKALELLQEMYEKSTDDESFKPHVGTYNAIFAALPQARGKTICEQARALYEEMRDHEIVPNGDTYRYLLATYSRQPKLFSSDMEELFYEMKHRYEEEKSLALQPNRELYLLRLQAWYKLRHPEMTRHVLQEMVHACETNLLDTPPETTDFNVALKSWSESNRPNAAFETEELFRQMASYGEERNWDCHPDTTSYNHVISAYAKSSMPQAGERALELFTELLALSIQQPQIKQDDKRLQPDSVTFFETLVALTQSKYEHGEEAVRLMLTELVNKDAKFWKGKRGRPLLFKLGQVLDSSVWLAPSTRQELLRDFEELKRKILNSKPQQQKQQYQ